MKDFLEKFTLTEFFAYLCPGVILFCSFALWIASDLNQVLGSKLEKHPLVVAFILLVACYALGLIVTAWGSSGANLYVREYLYRRVRPRRPRLREQMVWIVRRFLHEVPVPRQSRSMVDGQLRIAEDLERYAGLPGLSALQSPWDRLTTYRTIIADRLGESGRSILAEAETVHRRMLFALGVALALLLVALQSWLLFAIHCMPEILSGRWPASLHDCLERESILVIMSFLELAASIGLRRVAGRLWEQELLLTCSLTRVQPQNSVTA